MKEEVGSVLFQDGDTLLSIQSLEEGEIDSLLYIEVEEEVACV